MSTIEENKKSTLSDLLRNLESEISKLYHMLEEDQSISDDKFAEYEKKTNKLFEIHTELQEEVTFS